jgi:hypothetical protein
MNYNKFISLVEAYYGKYEPPKKKEIIVKYIMSKYKEFELESLYKKIILNIESKFKTPPDIKQLEDLDNENIEIKADKLYEEISREANQYRDLVIEDKAGLMAFKSACGNTSQFALRTKRDEAWIKKRFIEMYKMYSNNPNLCDGDSYIPGIGKSGDPVLIGDNFKCQLLLEKHNTSNDMVQSLMPDLKRIE